jgi:hypothetical protein
MDTVASMIVRRLGQIEASAQAAAKERRLWEALREIAELASGLKAEIRVERAANGVTPALKWMAELDRTMERMITTAASRASDREAVAMRHNQSESQRR